MTNRPDSPRDLPSNAASQATAVTDGPSHLAPATTPPIAEEDGARALEAAMPDLEALDPSQLKIPTNVRGTVSRVLQGVPRLRTLLPELERHGFSSGAVDELRQLAFALHHTNLLHAQAERRVTVALSAMAAEAYALQERIAAEVKAHALCARKDVPKSATARLGNGYADLAMNLADLVELVRSDWEGIKGQTRITDEDLRRACVLSVSIPVEQYAIGSAAVRSERSQIAELRRRVFTLLLLRWEKLRRGVALIRFEAGDADTFAPSLYVPNKRRKARASETSAAHVEPGRARSSPGSPTRRAP